jgi:hypothetical protein
VTTTLSDAVPIINPETRRELCFALVTPTVGEVTSPVVTEVEVVVEVEEEFAVEVLVKVAVPVPVELLVPPFAKLKLKLPIIKPEGVLMSNPDFFAFRQPIEKSIMYIRKIFFILNQSSLLFSLRNLLAL